MSRFLGDIRQNGYVVRDIERAMRHWTEVMGIGPFFYIEDVPVSNFRYGGQPSDVKMSIALANSGPLQIELIQQRNDAPSMYLDFLNAGHEGLQHVAFWTADFDADMARMTERGFEVGHSGQIGADGRFVYFTRQDHPGSVIELSETNGRKGAFFQSIRDAAAGWDGSDPVRKV